MSDFMLYLSRVLWHLIGYSSVKFFLANNLKSKAQQLEKGIWTYWGVALLILAITRSPTFVFWILIQPLMCMNYFLALINFGFHGFIEFDEHGEHVKTVNSTLIIEGEDDFFGEDDHMSHHYNTNVYFKDLPAHQLTKIEEFKRTKASVFRKVSIIELSIFILLGLWDKLADHYVDYTGKMTREEIKTLLRERAQRKETTYAQYQVYLNNPTAEAKKQLIRESAVTKPLSLSQSASAKSSSSSADAAAWEPEQDSSVTSSDKHSSGSNGIIKPANGIMKAYNGTKIASSDLQ